MVRKNTRKMWAEKIEKSQVANPEKSARKDNVITLQKPQKLKLANEIQTTKVAFSGIVIGIDPSLRGTGLAVVRMVAGKNPEFLDSYRVSNPAKLSQSECLGNIFRAVDRLCVKYEVSVAAVEQTIYVQNNQTALILGSARGAAIAAAANFEIPVFEYPPLRIKQAVVGFGRASKEQVSRTVAAILRIAPLGFDESDAAAAALAHIFTFKQYI